MKKLRPYKGVAYNPEIGRWLYDRMTYLSAASLIAEDPHFTDDDHAELMDLKKNPYEPVPRLEDVLHDAYAEWFGSSIASLALPQFIANRLRAVFPHIDQEER